MANPNFIREQIMYLEDGFAAKNGFTAIQVKLIETELARLYIENVDVENAIFYFVKTKQGRQSLPSVEAICAEVERQRADRIASEKFKSEKEHPLSVAEQLLTSELHRLHCKALTRKFASGLPTPYEFGTAEAMEFRQVCETVLPEIDISKISDRDIHEFTKSPLPALRTEFEIVADVVKSALSNYDPFADE